MSLLLITLSIGSVATNSKTDITYLISASTDLDPYLLADITVNDKRTADY